MGWKGAGRDAAGGGCGRDVGGMWEGCGRSYDGFPGRGGAGWREGYEGEEMGMKTIGQSLKWGS